MRTKYQELRAIKLWKSLDVLRKNITLIKLKSTNFLHKLQWTSNVNLNTGWIAQILLKILFQNRYYSVFYCDSKFLFMNHSDFFLHSPNTTVINIMSVEALILKGSKHECTHPEFE